MGVGGVQRGCSLGTVAPRSEGRTQWAEGPWRSKDFLGFPWFSIVFPWFSLVFEPLASLLSVLMARLVLYYPVVHVSVFGLMCLTYNPPRRK